MRDGCRVLVAVFLGSFLTGVGFAGDPPDPPVNQDRTIEGLLRKNEELEERVRALEEGRLEPEEEAPESALLAEYGDVTFSFELYGDAGFRFTENPMPREKRGHSTFVLGSLVPVVTADLGEKFDVLSESLVQAVDDEVDFEQERLWGRWKVSERFYVKFGVDHTPLSRWARLYHRGQWLQPTIERPQLARFEEEDGLLPMHHAGVEIGGTADTKLGELEYFSVISNGRGIDPLERNLSNDRNDGKALDVGVALTPADEPDLHFGMALRHENIPRDTSSPIPGRAHSIREMIATAHADYGTGPWHFITEYAFIEHKARALNREYDHNSGYLQVAHRSGKWTLYGRADYRQMAENDPFFVSANRELDRWRQILGFRYDFAKRAAIKVEIGAGREEKRDPIKGVSGEHIETAAVELSWAF